MGEEVEKLATVLERVEEFAFVVGLRPNAMVRQEGRTLAIADLRRLMEAAATLERASAEQLRFMELYDAARGDVVQLEAQVEAMRKALERIRAKRDPLAMDVRWAVLDEIHEIVDAALSAPAEESSDQAELLAALKEMVAELGGRGPVTARARAAIAKAEARSEQPEWMTTERGPWVYHGLLSAARELRDRARHARNRFQRPSETADLYREPSEWYGAALEEAARALDQRAVEIQIAREDLPTPPKAEAAEQ